MRAEHRLEGLRRRLDEESVDAIAIVFPPNVAYITGFDNVFDDMPSHTAVVTRDTATLVTDALYGEAARTAAIGTEWVIEVAATSLAEAARDVARAAGAERIAIEDTLTYKRHAGLVKVFGENTITASDWVERLRAAKDDVEIERIAAAQEVTDAAFAHILDVLRPGLTETDIALELEFFMRHNGAEGPGFDFIVAAGSNSALPHARVGDRAVREGDFVKMDFGAIIGGYRSDMTRTVVVGQASDRQKELYAAVLQANMAGIAAVRAGVAGREVDAAARAALAAAGFEELFTHGLGHGVGREIHELPYLSARSDDVLEAGNVVTIEPGAYVSGFGGVRIEDLVVVQVDGARVLTRSPKDLIEIV